MQPVNHVGANIPHNQQKDPIESVKKFGRKIAQILKSAWDSVCELVERTAVKVRNVFSRNVPPVVQKGSVDFVEDTAEMSGADRLAWRNRHFELRKPIPPLTPQERADIESKPVGDLVSIQKEIEKKIEDSGVTLSETEKLEMVTMLIKHYTLSKQYYSPAILMWVDVLLQHADLSGKKLVFLARDGNNLHEVSKILIEKDRTNKYGEIDESKVILAWLSRASALDASKKGDFLPRYFKQLGIEENDELLMVDTGCTGSMKTNVRPMVKNGMEWQFSVSRNPAIHGFWDHADFSMQALAFVRLPKSHQDVWANSPQIANNWVEDAHQGDFLSAAEFVEDKKHNVIYPSPSYVLHEDQSEKGYHLELGKSPVTNKEELLVSLTREIGYRSVVDFARETNVEDLGMSYDQIKRNLNDLLTRIKKGEIDLPIGR